MSRVFHTEIDSFRDEFCFAIIMRKNLGETSSKKITGLKLVVNSVSDLTTTLLSEELKTDVIVLRGFIQKQPEDYQH